MKTLRIWILNFVVVSFLCLWATAQQATIPSAVVPRLVNFSGKATDVQGKPVSGIAGITFSIYKDQEGGAPLWMETQNVTADSKGNYTVQLGGSKSEGLPLDLFSSGEARWLGVRVNGGEEQPRVLLLSVPYALKAADAQTLGGLPPSAFVLATPPAAPAAGSETAGSASPSVPPTTPLNVTTSGGVVKTLPLWATATDIESSAITQTGTSTTAKIGINTTTPSATLDVKGSETVRGILSLHNASTATSTKGGNSQPLTQIASAFNSGTGKAVNQTFRWQAEPVGNNTANPSASLNLLFGSGSNTAAETGLNVASNGRITFAAGQPFPGTGKVNSVALSAPSSDFTVSGSPVTGTGTLGLNWNVAPTSSNNANAIVKRDASAGFSSGPIIATNGLSSSGPAAISGVDDSEFNFIPGVYGQSDLGFGVLGRSESQVGVFGIGPTGGEFQGDTYGVEGTAGLNGGIGVYGRSDNGVAIQAYSLNGQGLFVENGSPDDTAVIQNDGTGYLLLAQSTLLGGAVLIDGYGNLTASGGIVAASKHFRIDHPLDPANKYLNHASVESSEMMNIYTGNVTTDEQGEARVELPVWFESLNTDFRYQLTAIGQFALAIVARKIANHSFTIKTDKPSVEVSWQVTGVRQDAYAKAHPLVVEQDKAMWERGFYVHPELFGAPRDSGIDSAHRIEMAKQMKSGPIPVRSPRRP